MQEKCRYKDQGWYLPIDAVIIILFTLQAVKRSHRRLGLAQKLMEQVHQSVIVFPIDEGTCIWVK